MRLRVATSDGVETFFLEAVYPLFLSHPPKFSKIFAATPPASISLQGNGGVGSCE